MKLDLKGFQKVSKDGNSTTLKHPAGHEMTINHSILSPKMRGEIEALPHVSENTNTEPTQNFEQGGAAKPDPTPNPIPPGQQGHQIPTMHVEEGNPDAWTERQQTLQPPKSDRSPASDEPEKYVPEDPNAESPMKAKGGKVQKFAEGTPDTPVAQPGDTNYVAPKREDQEADKRVTEQDTAQDKSDKESAAKDSQDQIARAKSVEPETEDTRPAFNKPADDMSTHEKLVDSLHKLVNIHVANSPTPDTAQSNPQSPMLQPGDADYQPSANVQSPTNPTPAIPGSAAPTDVPPPTGAASTPPVSSTPQQPTDSEAALNQQQQLNAQYVAAQDTKNAQLYQAAMQDKIDPNRFYNSMSTPQKIMSAIGMIFGGIGASAATGGKNAGVEALNNLVAKDVDMQKSDISNRMNLYKMNLEATHNSEEARNMTMNQMLSVEGARMNKLATGNANTAAQLNAKLAGQEIIAKIRDNTQNAFMDKMREQALSGGMSNNTPLSTKIAYGLPKEEQAEAQKQAAEYDSYNRTVQNANNIFDKMDEEQSTPGLVNPQSYLRNKQNKAALVQTIMETSPSKRLTRESVEQEIQPFEFGTFSDQKTRDAGRQHILDLIKTHAGPMNILQDRGFIPKMDLSSSSSNWTPQQNKAVQLTMKANPGISQQQAVTTLKSRKQGGF